MKENIDISILNIFHAILGVILTLKVCHKKFKSFGEAEMIRTENIFLRGK